MEKALTTILRQDRVRGDHVDTTHLSSRRSLSLRLPVRVRTASQAEMQTSAVTRDSSTGLYTLSCRDREKI